MTVPTRLGRLIFVTALVTVVMGAIVARGRGDAAFEQPTSGMYAAVDCDIAAPGIQDACTLPASATSITVAVVLGNVDVPQSDISAIQFDVIGDQRFVEPMSGADGDKNANPNFEDASFGAGTWACTPPPPVRDANPDPMIADSFLSCFQSSPTGGQPFNAGSQIRAATVAYTIARTGTSNIRLDRLSVGDTAGAEVMSCNPVSEVPAACGTASIQVGATTPTATSTATSTPVPGITELPSATPTATVSFDPTVTPTSTSVPTPIPTPVLDTDGDGVLDSYEVSHPCMNVGIADGDQDPDGDELLSVNEGALLTDACAPDSDQDTMNDGFEATNECLDPLVPAAAGADSDGDALSDVDEVAERTLPCDPDSDRDGYIDGTEVALGEEPLAYCNIMRADVNGDRRVFASDLMLVAQQYGLTPPGNPRMDQGNDGRVNSLDLLRVAIVFMRNVAACE